MFDIFLLCISTRKWMFHDLLGKILLFAVFPHLFLVLHFFLPFWYEKVIKKRKMCPGLPSQSHLHFFTLTVYYVVDIYATMNHVHFYKLFGTLGYHLKSSQCRSFNQALLSTPKKSWEILITSVSPRSRTKENGPPKHWFMSIAQRLWNLV